MKSRRIVVLLVCAAIMAAARFWRSPVESAGLLGETAARASERNRDAIAVSQKGGLGNSGASQVSGEHEYLDLSIPAFPGAAGFGAMSLGGRGNGSVTPRIIAVTTLTDRVFSPQLGQWLAAPGSLREAVEASGPRFIIFKVYGTIYLDTPLLISNPYVTIAGQTAGGDGIVLAHWGLAIKTHDVVLRHLRIRMLYEETDGLNGRYMDGVTIYRPDYEVASAQDGARNIIFDHCSFAWAIDEAIDLWNWARDVTVQWCIISNGAVYGHEKGEHGSGMIGSVSSGSTDNGTARSVTFHHNFIAQNYMRCPYLDRGTVADLRNNVLYNWHYWNPVQLTGNMQANFVGNYLIAGLDVFYMAIARNAIAISAPPLGPFPKIFLQDNFGPLRTSSAQNEWDVGVTYQLPNVGGLCPPTSNMCSFMVGPQTYQSSVGLLQPAAAPAVVTQPALIARDMVLSGAGATKPKRDIVDSDLVSETLHVIDIGEASKNDPQVRRLGPHHGPLVDVLWFHPDADPNFLCNPRQKKLLPGENILTAKMSMLLQMHCTLPGGIKLPQDAAAVLANPVLFPFDVVQRIVPDRMTLQKIYRSNGVPSWPLDSDGDSIPNTAEAGIGSSPSINDSLQDADGDGYLNIEEYLNQLAQ